MKNVIRIADKEKALRLGFEAQQAGMQCVPIQDPKLMGYLKSIMRDRQFTKF